LNYSWIQESENLSIQTPKHPKIEQT